MRDNIRKDLLRLAFEAAVNHRGWGMADIYDLEREERRMKEDKRHE